jgi:hypothetical protein
MLHEGGGRDSFGRCTWAAGYGVTDPGESGATAHHVVLALQATPRAAGFNTRPPSTSCLHPLHACVQSQSANCV